MSLPGEEVKLIITDTAAKQILLISANDYTLENLVFRMKVGGKGCSGFTYETGFSEALDDDIIIKKDFDFGSVAVHLDPFTAYYCAHGLLDYQINPDTHEDGFVYDNYNEHHFQGKFFGESEYVPHHLEIK
jgi:Fe-S cluster assembly iron-binding protein IscA